MDDRLYGKTYDEIVTEPIFHHDDDIRWRQPGSAHRGAFMRGWTDATLRDHVYSDDTLRQLTWCNFGWRLGRTQGEASPSEIRHAFYWLAEQQGNHN